MIVVFCHVGVESGPGLEGRFGVLLGGEDHIFKKGEREGVGEESIREDCNIRIVIFALIIVRVVREEIGFIVFARLVDEFVVIFGQVGNIACNTAINLVWLAIVL